MNNASVYWIHRKVHGSPVTEGYVGVARCVETRYLDHLSKTKLKKHINPHLANAIEAYGDITYTVLFEGPEADCYTKESELRPAYKIGWNLVPGGHGGSTTLGTKLSEDHRQKMSAAMVGNTRAQGNTKPKSEEHKRKIKESTIGRRPKSEEWRAAHSAKMRGRKKPDGFGAAQAAHQTGTKRSEESKAKMRQAWVLRKERANV